MMNRIMFSLIIGLLAACSADDQATVLQAESKACDASATNCRVEFDGMAVSLALGPGVKPLQPFAVNAVIESENQPDQIIIDFQMTDMDMGLNRYRLLPEKGLWQGTVTLPVCTASRMDWIAVVEFSQEGKLYRLNFPFTTTQ